MSEKEAAIRVALTRDLGLFDVTMAGATGVGWLSGGGRRDRCPPPGR